MVASFYYLWLEGFPGLVMFSSFFQNQKTGRDKKKYSASWKGSTRFWSTLRLKNINFSSHPFMHVVWTLGSNENASAERGADLLYRRRTAGPWPTISLDRLDRKLALGIIVYRNPSPPLVLSLTSFLLILKWQRRTYYRTGQTESLASHTFIPLCS